MKKFNILNNKNFVVLLLNLFWFITSCSKDSVENNQNIINEDNFSKEDNLFLDKISSPNPNLNQIIGTDGRVLRKYSTSNEFFIDNILRDAQSLSGRKILLHPDEGPFKPLHYGIVYSYGQRDFDKRLPPNSGNTLHKKFSVFGTDCSGLMINLLNNQGLSIPNSTSVSTFEAELKKAVNRNTSFNNFSVENKGHLPFNEIKSGDFILWKSKRHMGIVATLDNLSKIIYNSNGDPFPENEIEQRKNLGFGRGVHPIKLDEAITTNTKDSKKSYWGIGYEIIRVTTNFKLGQNYQGGLIVYIDNSGMHGLIAAPANQSSAIQWCNGCFYATIGVPGTNIPAPKISLTSTVIGSGKANTDIIVAKQGTGNYAAKLCSDLVLGGYSDWYLPSKDELNMLSVNKNVIGGLQDLFYWSSSENITETAWDHHLPSSGQSASLKNSTLAVRAFRSF